MWSTLETVPCILVKKVYSAVFRWIVLYISVKSVSSNVSTAQRVCSLTTSPALLPFSVWLCLHIFSCGRSVLLILRLFSECSLYVVAALVCVQGKVSSESSYSVIFQKKPSRPFLFLPFSANSYIERDDCSWI